MNSSRLFIASDLHFGHKNIIKYCNRPWPDTETMNAGLVKNWNERVGKNDVVINLGDISLSVKVGHEWNRRLNGRKILLMGNHDEAPPSKYNEMGFEIIMRGILYLYDGEKWWALSHEPVHPDHLPNGVTNIHGHLHNNEHRDKEYAFILDNPRYINYSIERTNYFPVFWGYTETIKGLPIR